ncbi:hypothetical protein LUZ60_014159 [Juncus effusus]|nr:hypothetical protein LUZ60_014159 [Juncus effusus]
MERVKWVVGMGFWVQGFRCFPWLAVNFFLKDGLGVAPAALQILQNSANLPMVAKPLYGILSDSVPIAGQRRLPYVAIGALLQAIAWLAIGLSPSISLLTLSLLLLLSNLGASIAEVANDAIVAEAGKVNPKSKSKSTETQPSGQLQSFAWIFGSSAGALGNLIGGIAISMKLNPKNLFIFYAIILALQFFTTVSVHEKTLKLPSNNDETLKSDESGVRKKLSELYFAMSRPDISKLIIWFFISYAMIPLLLGTMFFYQTQHLMLDSSVIGLSKVFGQASLLIWSIIYEKYFKKTSPRKVISILQLLVAILMFSDVFFVKGIYQKIGISNSVYVIFISGLLEAVLLFKILPFSVLIAKLCPSGCEGSLMAFVMSALALSTIIGGYFGVFLTSFFGVGEKDFSKLPICILIEGFCAILPLYWASWISEGKKEGKKEE